ncbi:protein FAM57A-like [Limulus polyphemus]|uniref:Protein FAM57A-like n=1 Tax=Limulus polyphemus TaxID=6850 RepID=A0ABM1C2M5_LIMPO|nr:protein FAM57A-like [Limulus polyphemus]
MDVDISVQRGFVYFTIGITFFTSLFLGLKYVLRKVTGVTKGGNVDKTNYNLPYFALLEICNSLVSLIQSLVASSVGILIVSSCYNDVMHERNWLCNRYAWVIVAYLLYDTACMYLVHSYKHKQDQVSKSHRERVISFFRKNQMMMIHHIILPLVLFPVTISLRRGLGDFFLGCFYLVELSTPFTNLRSILSTATKVPGFMWLMAFS